MNNPFINLRKFVPDLADPKENQATESLAACLHFSPAIKAAFVSFLFGRTPLPFDLSRCADLQVATQVNVGKFGILDLHLTIPNELHIVIEVKVAAPEDEIQLRDYSKWLTTQTNTQRFLFSLIRHPDQRFPYQDYGVVHRRTWKELYTSFRKLGAESNPTEQNIIRFFNEYLEIQQIVSNWTPFQLNGMGKGFLARTVLNKLFEILAERLPISVYRTKSIISNVEWPRLEVGKVKWDGIFGQGYNNKLYVWFTVPGIWEATQHSFQPEIMLWNKQHAHSWAIIGPKIKSWAIRLKEAGFITWVEGKGIKRDEFDVTKSDISEAPGRIVAYSKSAIIPEKTIEKISENELVSTLYNMIVTHCEIVDGLAVANLDSR